MKKIIIIVGILAIAGSYLIWRNYTQKECCTSGENHEKQNGNYSFKMSMMCEHSCAAENVDKSKIVIQSKAAVGDFTQCPVSGVVFLVTDESSKVTYLDKSAFTCCTTCSDLFNETPREYIGNIN